MAKTRSSLIPTTFTVPPELPPDDPPEDPFDGRGFDGILGETIENLDVFEFPFTPMASTEK